MTKRYWKKGKTRCILEMIMGYLENNSLDSSCTSWNQFNSSWIKCRNFKRKHKTICIMERSLDNNLQKIKTGVIETFLTKIRNSRSQRRTDKHIWLYTNLKCMQLHYIIFKELLQFTVGPWVALEIQSYGAT